MKIAQALFLALVVTTIESLAQTYQGGVRGAVRDSTGIIPGVAVTLVDEGTNATRTTLTNDVGQYSFQSVQPGIYTLHVELAGFRPFQHTDIEIGVQRFVVLDVELVIGDIEESITVTGEAPLLETATASRSSSLESEEMKILPTPARNPFFLAITTPNVVPTGNPVFQRMQDQSANASLSIAGGPNRANNYTLDGVAITDLTNRAVIIPSLESVEEVKIQANTYDAEMGRTGG
ncbi:MAG TPA: carboxypeptidase-like regulatory domain-containing protein, partial [Vicinamibacteria bacterium]|nr:carboxypeptidase-like regulatory domain-containing protein [Vicinamibacteria bacterium]